MHPPSLVLQILLYTTIISAVGVLPPYSRLEVPFAHVALSGDVQIWLHAPPTSLPPLALSIWRLDGGRRRLVADISLHTPVLPAGIDGITNATKLTLPCGYLSKGGNYLLRLRSADQNLTETESYEDSKLSGVLDVRWPTPRLSMTPENIETFPENSVTAIVEFPEVMCPPIEVTALPEFWLELTHCGKSLCPPGGASVSPLYSEPLRGLPGRRELQLRCELFGSAGTYALALRPSEPEPTPSLTPTPAYLKARWSEQFVLNVHARSVFPCDGHSGVSVLFQYPACVLQRADRVRVFAKEPPVVSASSATGQERYVTELVITRGTHSLYFPCEHFSERYPEYCFVYVSQALNGAVADVRRECLPTLPILDGIRSGGWSPWSNWSVCSPGCGGTRARYRYCDSPPPPYGGTFCQGDAVQSEPCTSNNTVDYKFCPWQELLATLNSINIDNECKCGCVLRIGSAPRYLAASAQECKGNTYWLLQASPGHTVQLNMEKHYLSCGAQWLKVRDGSSPMAALLAAWPSDDAESRTNFVSSSSHSLLLEFFSDELLAAGSLCPGGFVAMATQKKAVVSNASASIASINERGRQKTETGAILLIILLVIGLVLSAPAACWATLRILHASRKYQRAADCDSLADSDMTPGSAAALTNRLTGSSGTLLSEVLSLRRLRVGRSGGIGSGHHLLRESKDLSEERPLDAQQNDCEENQAEEWSSESSVTVAAGDEASITIGISQIRPSSGGSLPAGSTTNVDNNHVSPLRRSRTCSPARSNHTLPLHKNSLISDGDTTSISVDMAYSTSERDSDNSSDHKEVRKLMATTPRIIRKGTLSENGSRSDSNTTLTNGCYSPALSTISCARVRTTNGKERKERRNLRLRAPPSDLSLAAPDFEFDYYDYNVSNAGTVPGSYLGMDPAFLVWIPPLEEGDIIKEIDEKHVYDDIVSKQNINPGSNTESPEDFHDRNQAVKSNVKTESNIPHDSPHIDRKQSMRTNIVHPLNFSVSDLAQNKKDFLHCIDNKINDEKNEKYVLIQMKELQSNKQNSEPVCEYGEDEKETYCEKSPNGLKEKYMDMSDIQFADEDSDSSVEIKVVDNKGNSNYDNKCDNQKSLKI